MDLLPNEVLMHILSLAAAGRGGGALLLDTLPLVCRRWRHVVADARCWARVDVDHRPGSDGRESARVVALAPALRSLKLLNERYDESESAVDAEPFLWAATMPALERALRVSEAVVLDAVAVTASGLDGARECALLPLLHRSRDRLRSLKVDLFCDCDCDWRTLRAAAALRRLSKLRLRLWPAGFFRLIPSVAYSGQLAAMATTCLRDLEVTVTTDLRNLNLRFEERFYPMALVEDALRCGAATLKAVTLFAPWPLPASTLRLLDECPRLVRLAAHHSCFGAAVAMGRVRELALHFFVESVDYDVWHLDAEGSDHLWYPDDEVDDPALSDLKGTRLVRRAVGLCEGLPMLESLVLQLTLCGDEQLIEEGWLRSECGRILDGLSELRPTIEVELIIDNWNAVCLERFD